MADNVLLVIAAVTIFAAVINLITVAIMFAQLAKIIGRVLERVVINREVEHG